MSGKPTFQPSGLPLNSHNAHGLKQYQQASTYLSLVAITRFQTSSSRRISKNTQARRKCIEPPIERSSLITPVPRLAVLTSDTVQSNSGRRRRCYVDKPMQRRLLLCLRSRGSLSCIATVRLLKHQQQQSKNYQALHTGHANSTHLERHLLFDVFHPPSIADPLVRSQKVRKGTRSRVPPTATPKSDRAGLQPCHQKTRPQNATLLPQAGVERPAGNDSRRSKSPIPYTCSHGAHP